ncbi:hypothetical protein VZX61_002672 [Salmonella enterica]|nr:hypothetical protein [Salmonella enterica]EHK8114766.1 hypothetical protein [Salmonella enterica subsp. enterica serovar Irumu]HDP0239102.1 hypothetical protein [Salmonella enterica subsp. enterica serovar Concord]ECZ7239834.1 hypothetical protein [Salmonella enterica]EFR3752445.1 hypothetical protein [Salmonella enterica]
MANLIFGEPSLFSINISTDDRFASVSIFCASEEIGDSSEYVLLSTFISLIKNKIDDYDYSLSNELFNLEKNDVFSYVVDGFEKAESWRESQRLESILITLNLAPCFDGETFILLSTDEYDRIIWKTFNSEIISEAFLPAGYVLKQFDLLFNNFSN